MSRRCNTAGGLWDPSDPKQNPMQKHRPDPDPENHNRCRTCGAWCYQYRHASGAYYWRHELYTFWSPG